MSEQPRYYIAIDLKSFYASVECVDRGLDPLDTNLVVADRNRTEKTICLAVSPALKSLGIPGRARLFEVVEKVRFVNAQRKQFAPGKRLVGKKCSARDLAADPSAEVGFLTAIPRMARYMEISAKINSIYMRTISPEDMHVYSIDEVFIDCTPYLKVLKLSAKELASKLIREVYDETGITATAGVGTNLYLCKVAMDILAKHVEPDVNGVRIAELDERSYREKLWNHRPLIDFWRVGRKYAQKLERIGLYTMGDIAQASINDEDIFYNMFGINAELLIDHAWGWESCTIADIHAHKSEHTSISSGQVLKCAYSAEDARLIVREMADSISMDLASKNTLTNRVRLAIVYDSENSVSDEDSELDYYGRKMPKQAHGTGDLGKYTFSTKAIVQTAVAIFDRIVDPKLTVRRIYITACDTRPADAIDDAAVQQLSMFDLLDPPEQNAEEDREQARQAALIGIRKKFGANAVLKGMSLKKMSTARERNDSIGGHKA